MEPAIVRAAAQLRFCTGDPAGAEFLFSTLLSMDDGDGNARFMRYLIYWLLEHPDTSPDRQALLAMDWRSSFDFFGYLARLLEGRIDANAALAGDTRRIEKSWAHYIVGQLHCRQRNFAAAKNHLEHACLLADRALWLRVLALAKLEDVWQTGKLPAEGAKVFRDRLRLLEPEETRRRQAADRLTARLEELNFASSEYRATLEELFALDLSDNRVLLNLIFSSAADAAWETAIDYCRRYRQQTGRENLGRLTVGWMEPALLLTVGQSEPARQKLAAFIRDSSDKWHAAIARSMLGEMDETELMRRAGNHPEFLLTGHAALGLWKEAQGNLQGASRHYREAVTTYLDDWPHFMFALSRLERLRHGER
jgi:hypothetical protein